MYDACHELAACMLTAALGRGTAAEILVAGAGGGAKEITTAGALEPQWRFMAVDPSEPMMDLALARLAEAELLDRKESKHPRSHADFERRASSGLSYDGACSGGLLWSGVLGLAQSLPFPWKHFMEA
jgi:hypothetical protein